MSNITDGKARIWATRWYATDDKPAHPTADSASGLYRLTLVVFHDLHLWGSGRAVVDDFGNLTHVQLFVGGAEIVADGRPA